MRTARSQSRSSILRLMLALIAAAAVLISQKSPSIALGDDQVQLTQDGLLISSRDRLAVCVQGIQNVSIDGPEAEGRLAAALAELANDPIWSAAGFARAAPEAAVGCPEPPVLLRDGVVAQPNFRQVPGSILAESPSKFLVFLFVAPPAFIESMFIDGPASSPTSPSPPYFRLEHEQLHCFGGSRTGPCVVVTSGLYLTPDEFRDHDTLVVAMGNAIGLPCPPCRVPSAPSDHVSKPISPQ